jgi:hypothetical protein
VESQLPSMFPAVVVEELSGFSTPEGLNETLRGCYTFLRGERCAWPTHVGLDLAWIVKDTGNSTRREVDRSAPHHHVHGGLRTAISDRAA